MLGPSRNPFKLGDDVMAELDVNGLGLMEGFADGINVGFLDGRTDGRKVGPVDGKRVGLLETGRYEGMVVLWIEVGLIFGTWSG